MIVPYCLTLLFGIRVSFLCVLDVVSMVTDWYSGRRLTAIAGHPQRESCCPVPLLCMLRSFLCTASVHGVVKMINHSKAWTKFGMTALVIFTRDPPLNTQLGTIITGVRSASPVFQQWRTVLVRLYSARVALDHCIRMNRRDDIPLVKRFTHKTRKSKKSYGTSQSTGEFRPSNMLGCYQVRSASFTRLMSSDGLEGRQDMWFEIHQLVAADTAYLASFDFGIVSGIMLIAGSRKSLRGAVIEVDQQESAQDAEDEEEQEPDTVEIVLGEDREALSVESEAAFISASDLHTPEHAFEKNTFRTPKWFAQWRGLVSQSHNGQQQKASSDREQQSTKGPNEHVSANETDEAAEFESSGHVHADDGTHNAHLEFSTAACDDFQGTFTCLQLGLKDAAWRGWKTNNRASPASSKWFDFA